MKVIEGTMTSSPGPMPKARRARTSASVPDPQPAAAGSAVRVGETLLEPLSCAADEGAAVDHVSDRGVEFFSDAVV